MEESAQSPPETEAKVMQVEDLLALMESPIKLIASKLVKKHGYSDNYELVLSTTMSNKYIGAVTAGGKPKIYLNASNVITLMGDKKGVQLKYILGQLLEKAARMQHTLSLSPIAQSIALPCEAKSRFVKNPSRIFTVDYKRIVVTYTVTAMDSVTGDAIDISTHSLANVEEAGRIAIERLAKVNGLMIETEVAEVVKATPNETDPAKIKFGNVFVENLGFAQVKLTYDVDNETL